MKLHNLEKQTNFLKVRENVFYNALVLSFILQPENNGTVEPLVCHYHQHELCLEFDFFIRFEKFSIILAARVKKTTDIDEA